MNLSGGSPFRVQRRGRIPIQINSSSSGLTTLKQLLSGYEEEFVDEVDEELACLICKFPLRMPMLTTCGHRFCKGCLDQHFERFVLGLNPAFLTLREKIFLHGN